MRALYILFTLWALGQALFGWVVCLPWYFTAFFIVVAVYFIWATVRFPRQMRRILDGEEA